MVLMMASPLSLTHAPTPSSEQGKKGPLNTAITLGAAAAAAAAAPTEDEIRNSLGRIGKGAADLSAQVSLYPAWKCRP